MQRYADHATAATDFLQWQKGVYIVLHWWISVFYCIFADIYRAFPSLFEMQKYLYVLLTALDQRARKRYYKHFYKTC
jgi:hypothetical protein